MKKFIPIFIFLLTIVNGQDRFAKKGKTVSAQKDAVEKMSSTSNQPVPRRISYQGLITKADGSPTDDGSYEILFKVYGTADGGEAVWSENQEVTVNNGIISTILGNTNPFTVIPPEAFLELTVAGSTLSPRQVLTSVFYSVLSDTSAYAKTANYESLSNLPDLDIYVLKDSLENYATSADLYDTLSAYQKLDSNLTDLVEDGLLSASKVEYGISSVGDSGQTWISDGDGAGTWGNPASVAADDIIIGDGNISIQTINGGISIVPSDGYNITLDSTITIDGNLMGLTNDSDLLTFSRDTLTVRGTVMASTIGGFAVLDEDDMASDSELQLATQQSIKAYADSKQSYNENLEAIGSLEHGDGSFLVSNGSEWTVESDSLARASLGLGSIAMLDSDNMDINGGTIDGTIIGSENPQVGNFTTVQAESRAYVGDMIIDSGSITSESGTVSFDDETITTSGTLSSGSGSTIGNLTLADGSISSASNQIDFGDDDLSTTGTLSTGIATLGSGSTIGNLTFTDGTIASESDNISFGSDNLSTNGTLTAGVSTLSSGSEIGDLTLSNGSITSSSDAIDFGNDALSTTGTLSAGTATLATGSTVGNLTLADGSITSSSDAIDFGNDALSTTGTLSTGTATMATGSTVGNLTLSDGSITSSSNAIDFGNNTLTTSSTITANAFSGDGSNITGVEASSMGILAGVSPIVLEGESINDFETILSVEDPTLSDKTITFPNATGTIITTGNDSAIDEVGTITSGEWQGTPIADAYVPNDITLSGATIDNSVIGGTTPAAVTATTLTAGTGIISGGTIDNSVIGGTTPAAATVTTITTNDSIVPDESDGATLGTSSAEFSDIFLADGAVINLGDEQDVTLTHVEDTGIKLNGSSQIQFGDSGTQISQSADGVLDLVSDNEVEINGTTIDMNGAVDISGAVTTGSTITTTGSLLPSSVDGAGLGSSSAEFSDVFLADGALINLGNNQDVTLTHIKDTGIKINDANQIQFGDSGTQISQSADGVLDLVSDNEVEINGTTIDMNGVVDISGAVTTGSTITTTGSLLPASSDGAGLGSSSAEFSDVFLADGAVINLGDNQEVTLTHIEDEGLRLNTLSQMQFGDSGTKISQSADGVLDLVSDNEVEINGTTIDINGNTTLDNATIDFVKVDGTYVGHVDDTDLMNLANGTLTVSGTLAATTFSGDGSNLTGISASSIKSDDISQGDAAVNITTSSGAININPASGSPVLIDNTINIDGSLIGHADDTDLLTLANGSVTFTGTTVVPTADINGGAIDAVTLGTNSAVTQAVVDNVNIDGALIGHTSDTDLMTLADGSVTFTGTTVVPTADINGGAIDAVTLGTSSPITQAVIDNINMNGAQIGHATDTDLMTLSNGTLTVAGTVAATTVTGDGSGLTGITASEMKSDDISQGDAAVTISTSSGAVNINPASGSPILLDNTINIDGSLIGHTDDTDLMTLADGSVTFTGSTVITTADVNGGAIDAVTLGTNSAVTQAVIDNVNINGAEIGHTLDTDLMTLADGSVTFTGSTVIPTVDVNGGAIDAVTLGTNSAVTQAVIDNVSINGSTIGHTDDTDLLTLANGVATVAGEISATTLDIGGTDVTSTAAELNKLDGVTATTTELNYVDVTTLGTSEASKAVTVDANGDLLIPDSDKYKFGAGSDMQLYHDGSNSYITNATGAMKVATETSGIAITIGHSTSETTIADNLTVGGDAAVAGDVTITGNDITFGNGETISNATDGDFLFTTGTQTGALTVKNSNTTDGIASLELVSDNSGDVGDGYELKSVNGTFTITSDHSTKGTYEDTYLTIVGNSTPASSSTIIAGDLTIAGNDLTMDTNTSGAALIGDGTNYNPVVISGDLSIGSNGTAAISSNVIVNADINASAAIADSKLATLTTVDKVSGAAIQVDGATSGTGITLADDDKFLVDDGGTTKYVNASQILSYASATSSTDINGGTIDGVTLGTNSAVTQAVIDNVNINGAEIGHTSDTDLMTLADGSVTFTGSTVIPVADVNGGAVDGVTLGTNSAVTQAIVDNINLNGATIGHTSDTDLMTLADGSVTFTGSTVVPNADINGGSVDGVTLGTNSAVTRAVIDNVNIDGTTIGHTSDTDLLTLSSGVVTLAGNLTFENGESVSNATDGDFLFTTDVTDGALVLKNSNATDGTAKIELVSDNADNAGDGYEIKSVNGTFTVTSDHSSSGTYNDTYLTIDGNATPASSTTKIAGDLLVDGGQIALTGDTDLITLSSGVVTVAGELSATTLDINGTDITSTATEINFNDGTSAGTVVASKTVVVDANKDIASFRNITLTGELDAGSLDVSGNADIDGTLEADAITVNGSSLASVIQGTTVNSATTGTNVVITDNENTSENNAIAFVANADLDGNSSIGLESDGDLHYNPSTGTVTATAFVGDGSNLTGITASTIGTLSGANAISFRDTDLAINSSTDGQMDINADVTVDIQAPTTTLSGDITISGNDISFGNSETISNASDNVIAITSASTTLSGDLTVTGNDITFGNGETISNATDGDFIFTTGTANGALTLKNSNASDGKAAIELVSDNANEVGDGYEIQSLNGVFTVTGDHSTSGTYDDTFITVNGNSTPASSYTTIAGDLRVDGGEIGISGDTDLVTLASGRATVDGELVVTSLDIGGTDITSTPAELNIIDGNTSATGTTVAGADRVVLNDAGTMVQVAMTDIDTYISGTSKTLTNKTLTSPVVNTPTITGNTTFSDGGYNFNIASHDGTNGLALAGTVITATASELNKLDGGTSATNTTVADADRVVLNDAGSMVQVAMTDIDTYISGTTKTLTNKTLTSPVINTPTITGNTTFSDGAYDFNIASHDGTNGLALGGTVVNATADELNTYVLNVSLDDISTASSCYVVAPKAGTLTRIYSVIDGTIGTADAVITASVNGGSNVTQTLTIANGSNAGIKDDCTPADNNSVGAGQYIQLTTNGASTNSVSAVFSLVITH